LEPLIKSNGILLKRGDKCKKRGKAVLLKNEIIP
jgi:hypothetical protein